MNIWDKTNKQWNEANLLYLLEDNRSGMFYTRIPPAGEASLKSRHTFQITFFSSIKQEPVINLYSQYSRSRPYQDPQNKWGHLLPQWRFYDQLGNQIESLLPEYTEISNGTEIVGVTGVADFYYVDDMPTYEDCPLHIWATLDATNLYVEYDNEKATLPGHANSLVTICLPYHINMQDPTYLEITRNGEDDFRTSWEAVEYPYVITVRGPQSIPCFSGDEYQAPIIFGFPLSGFPTYNIQRNLQHTNPLIPFIPSDQRFDPEEQQFVRYDENNFDAGGFVRGTFISFLTSESIQISSSVSAVYDPWFRDMSLVWVSNPNNRTMNILRSFPTRGDDCPTTTDLIVRGTNYSKLYTLTGAEVFAFDTPYLTSVPDNMSLTGFGGIFGIAADTCYNAWVTDAEMDAIFKFDYDGTLLKSIYLKDQDYIQTLIPNLSAETGLTPAGIALDGEHNFWVTLYDHTSALKFNYNGDFLLATQPAGALPPPRFENQLYKGSQVDTDTENNIWITYNQYEYSELVKYNSNGVILNTVVLPAMATPIDIVVDGFDDSIWITLAYLHHKNGEVRHYDKDGISLHTQPLDFWASYITIDTNRNPWFTFGLNKIGRIDRSDYTLQFFKATSNTFIAYTGHSDEPFWYDEDDRLDEHHLGGIAADARNHIWIINSLENRVYLVDGDTPNITTDPRYASFFIAPNSKITWYNNSLEYNSMPEQYEEFNIWQKSAQAFGDWTAYRWLQKYNKYETVHTTLTGVSNEFEIVPFISQNIRRFNESWNAAESVQSYALPEHVNNFQNLWSNYIGEMVGKNEDNKQELGRQSYEKIANFTKDHADIDTAGVAQLFSLAESIDLPIDDYQFSMPANIKRILDIVSVPHDKLWGARCKCNKHFSAKQICERCNHEHSRNLGTRLNSLTYIVTADEPFIVSYIHATDHYEILTPEASGVLTSYPLSATTSIEWLLSSEYENYNFWTWDQTFCNVQTHGIINWSDDFTTLLEENSSIEDWYKDDGIVEQMINYEFFRGVGLGPVNK